MGKALAQHAGVLVIDSPEDGASKSVGCGLVTHDPGWLKATADAIADALGEPLTASGGEGGGAPDRKGTDADA